MDMQTCCAFGHYQPWCRMYISYKVWLFVIKDTTLLGIEARVASIILIVAAALAATCSCFGCDLQLHFRCCW